MTEEELRKRGYYLFGIDNNRFVQVRELETDKIVVIGQGEGDALLKAEILLEKQDHPNQPRCFNVELSMTVTVQARNHEDAETAAFWKAGEKLASQDMSCLVVQPAEETECDEP